MKHKISLLILAALTVMVASCSKPSLYKPTFKDYGIEVSYNALYDAYFQTSQKYFDKLYTTVAGSSNSQSTSRLLNINLKIECVQSVYLYSSNGKKTVKAYAQASETTYIDVRNKRFKDDIIERAYISGDKDMYAELDTFEGKNAVARKESHYGEIDWVYVHYYDNINRTYTIIRSSTLYDNSNVSGYESKVLQQYVIYLDGFMGNYLFYDSEANYYLSGETFTMEYRHSNNEATIQVEFGKAIKMKIKEVATGETTNNDYYRTRLESYTELVVVPYGGSVGKQDCSSYTVN